MINVINNNKSTNNMIEISEYLGTKLIFGTTNIRNAY